MTLTGTTAPMASAPEGKRWRRGMGNRKRHRPEDIAGQVERAQRGQKVLALKRQGLTDKAIAILLTETTGKPVSEATVRRDRESALREQIQTSAEEHRALIVAAYTEVYAAHIGRATSDRKLKSGRVVGPSVPHTKMALEALKGIGQATGVFVQRHQHEGGDGKPLGITGPIVFIPAPANQAPAIEAHGESREYLSDEGADGSEDGEQRPQPTESSPLIFQGPGRGEPPAGASDAEGDDEQDKRGSSAAE